MTRPPSLRCPLAECLSTSEWSEGRVLRRSRSPSLRCYLGGCLLSGEVGVSLLVALPDGVLCPRVETVPGLGGVGGGRVVRPGLLLALVLPVDAGARLFRVVGREGWREVLRAEVAAASDAVVLAEIVREVEVGRDSAWEVDFLDGAERGDEVGHLPFRVEVERVVVEWHLV